MHIAALGKLFLATWNEWNEDKAPRLAAALAYYALFSLAPLLIIAIAVAGLVFGREAVEGRLFLQISGMVGDTGAATIQELIRGASSPTAGIISTVIGVATLLLGAAGLFGQLQDALNTIWDVEPKPNQGLVEFLRQRFFSFAMVLGTGFMLLVSLVLSTVLAAVNEYANQLLPGADLLWKLLDLFLSFALTTGLFALIFKLVPDIEIKWGDVWVGAVITAVLFSLGRFILAQYLGRSTFGSAYGAAGSLVVVLVWIYYSSQILLFGAEFTQVYARTHGSGVREGSR